jgi:hypothetical protein
MAPPGARKQMPGAGQHEEEPAGGAQLLARGAAGEGESGDRGEQGAGGDAQVGGDRVGRQKSPGRSR